MLSLAFACGLAAEGRAQSSANTGTIAGEVLNQATGQYLPGALVQIAGTTSNTTTDRSGAFSIAAAVGAQTLEISFTGLDTVRVPVMIEAGKVVRQTVELTSSLYKLEPVTVAGVREGNALAIQAQRLADNVKTVISTDAFGTPAVNPGELLQRLTGVNVDLLGGEAVSYRIRGLDSTWTNLMVDGNSMATSMGTSPASRLVNIQQIGTNNIESIELIKAPTSDMDANAIGGYVNMITKRAFDRAPGQEIRLSAGTRWTRLKGGDVAKDKPGLDQLGFSFSNVYSIFGKKNNLGILLNASQRISPAVTDEAGPANSFVGAQTAYILPTAQNGLTTPVLRAFGTGSLFWPDQRNRTIGLNIDYKLSQNSYVYLKNGFNTTRIPGNGAGAGYVRMVTSVPAVATNFAPGSTYDFQEVLPVPTSTTELLMGHQKRKTNSYSVSGGFERKFPESGSTLNFDASYSLADVSYPVISLIRMSARGIGWSLDRRGIGDSFEPTFTQTAGPSIYDPASYTPNAATNFKQVYTAPKQNMAFRLDYKKNFSVGIPAYIKTGAKYSNNHLEQTNRVNYTGYIGPAGIPAKYVGPSFTQGGGNYGPFPYLTAPFSGLSGDIMQDKSLWAARGIDAYNSALYSDQGRALDGEMDESVAAAYLMGSVTVAKLRIVPGLRVERTDVSATGYPRNQTASWGGNFDPTLSDAANAARALRAILPAKTQEKSYQNVFPGVHFIYEPLDRLLVRASYNTSIVRPPVASLMPTVVINPELRTLTAPNLELKPYTSDNFEFAVQKYFEPVGSFEVGVFLKEIKNYIRTIPVVIGSGPNNGFGGEYEGYTWNMAQNTGNARIRGFEINYQQQYSFLPGLWRGLGSFANFTYTDAQGNFGTTLFQRRIAYQRPRTANAGISYRGKGFEVRLLGNWQGSYYILGAGATSIYSDPQLMIDMKSTYNINRTYQLYFDIMNLTNENVSTMVQEGGMKIYAQKQGVIFSAGLNLRF